MSKVRDMAAQLPLVSGQNIKTVNNSSLLGSGNITITGGGGGATGDLDGGAADSTFTSPQTVDGGTANG